MISMLTATARLLRRTPESIATPCSVKKNQAGGPTKIAVTSNEDGNVSATGTQTQTGKGGGEKKRAAATARIAKKKGGKKLNVKLKPVSRDIAAGQTVILKLKLTASARKSLRQRRKIHIKVRFTFTPTGGTANSKIRAFTVKLPKKKH